MSWIFQPTSRMGGATGEAFSNVLQNTGMGNSAVLAREAIQNSVDAKSRESNEKVQVHFRHFALTHDAKLQLVAKLELKEEFAGRRDALTLPGDNCLDDLDSSTSPLSVLFIEDFGTHGLYGDPSLPTSHFHKLLFTLGDSSKARGAGTTGGSYGYGKGVYSSNSRIRTLIAYSVFNEDEDGVYARLIGCSYFNSHEYDERFFTGRAWFGIPDPADFGAADAFENEEAQEVATTLGFTPRARGETGTSILILDCPIDVSELRTSIENWWWPRLVANELDIMIADNGVRTEPPRPRKRPELERFIHCFNMARGTASTTGDHEKSDRFNALKGTQLGSYGLSVVDAPQEPEDEDLVPRIGTVALIRSPQMVVSYLPIGGNLMPFKGVVVASNEIDLALKLSEPPAHDKWDPKSDRFTTSGQRAAVEALLRRTSNTVRRFAKEATPPSPPGEVRMDALERLLGSTFKLPASKGSEQPNGETDPISVEFPRGPILVVEGTSKRVEGEIAISLSHKAEIESMLVSIQLRCVPREDQGLGTRDAVPINMKPLFPTSTVEGEPDGGMVTSVLHKDEKLHFSFFSEPYPGYWTVSVAVDVEGMEQQ